MVSRAGRRAVLLAVGLLALLLRRAGLPAAAAAKVAFTIADRRITETSGIARDTTTVYWTVNDSGALGVVYGSTPTARSRARCATAPSARRRGVAWNRTGSTSATSATTTKSGRFASTGSTTRARTTTRTYNAWDFRYPDGSHDAETLLVNPDGRLYIATKGAKGGSTARPGSDPRPA